MIQVQAAGVPGRAGLHLGQQPFAVHQGHVAALADQGLEDLRRRTVLPGKLQGLSIAARSKGYNAPAGGSRTPRAQG